MYLHGDDVRRVVREDAKLLVTAGEHKEVYAGVCITVLAYVLEVV